MSSEDGKVVIVFNGEIYNFLELKKGLEGRGFKFKSQSDTEVLLNLYLAEGETMFNSGSANTQLNDAALITAGGGQAHTNMQPFLAINYIIALVGLFPSRS